MVVLRLVIAGLVAALGVALWVSGHVLVGGLILALAVARLVLFGTMRHRRNQWRRRGGVARRATVPYEPPA